MTRPAAGGARRAGNDGGSMGGMRLDRSGKTALVTRSTQGIGKAVAAGRAAAGARGDGGYMGAILP